MIPLACTTLLLSSFSQIEATERDQLTFLTYGFSRRKLGIGQFLKGLMISTIGILPVQALGTAALANREGDMIVTSSSIVLAAFCYSIPFVRRLRSNRFVNLLKS